MINIRYAPTFVRMYKKIDDNLQHEVKEKIELFKDKKNHESLKVHKLKIPENTYSFRVNYKIRVVFEYEDKENTVNLLYIGGHDEVY